MHLLQVKGVHVAYHDPLYPMINNLHAPFAELPLCGVDLTDEVLAQADAVVIITDHPQIDYQRLADRARLVVDTRGVMRGIAGSARIGVLSGGERPPGEHGRPGTV